MSGRRRELTLCIFAKVPRAGEAKTRLAATVGADAAAELARASLLDTVEGLRAVPNARLVVATTGPLELDLGGVQVWDQGGGSLGERLERVLRRAIDEGGLALALGADTPGLPLALVEEARAALASKPAALGPSDDGGFWGLALTGVPEGLLRSIAWSSRETFAQTRSRLEASGLEVEILPRWFDVDLPSDLTRLRRAFDLGVIEAPRTRAWLDRHLERRPQRISVVVAVLDEERRIEALLQALVRMEALDEIIVVDGGSRDGTPAIVRHHPDVKLVTAPRGRGSQLNAGARAATGDVLWFVHADSRLPVDAPRRLLEALEDPGVVAGAFRTWTVRDEADRRLSTSRLPDVMLHLADLRSRYTSLPYGDQALFVRRAAFDQVGGFPKQPLFEDLELSRRLRCVGRIARLRQRVQVSGRRFLARPVRETLFVNLLPIAYRAGIHPARLAGIYRDIR